MPDKPRPPHLGLAQKTDVRLHGALLARVQTVQLLKMGETQIAEFIKDLESDPLFQKLVYPPRPEMKVIRYQPHPRTQLSGGFYELDEKSLPSGTPVDVVELLQENEGVISFIRRMGREKFERLFLKADTSGSPEALAKECALSVENVRAIQSFLLDFSVRAEFFDASTRSEAAAGRSAGGRRIVRLARLEMLPNGDTAFSLMSPHLARGRYEIHYDRFEALAQGGDFSLEEKRHLRALIRRLELINWRQNAIYRILDLLCHSQRHFLQDKDSLKKRPLTQRQLARQLSVAPSTVNRAIQDRSVVLPWGHEVLLEELFCSRKDLCVEALEALEARDPQFASKTDTELQETLRENLGFAVPRRTVNTYRHLLP